MFKRIQKLFKKMYSVCLSLVSGGALALAIFLYFTPSLHQMIVETGGMIGVPLVLVFAIGSTISSTIYWIVTGETLFDILGM